ncbi:hypothetical protein [Salinisphaera sp. T31B1]|uniref:hypothetical protein n=1 Tax=Salinisphaera sp. T31B1 TaxID=727963 RepID=UPI003342947C
MTRLLPSLAYLGLMVGCATAPEPAPAPVGYVAPPPLNSMRQPVRLTAASIGGDLGGAAYRVRAIEDVLWRNSDDLLAAGDLAASDPPYDRLVAQLNEHNTTQMPSTTVPHESIALAWRRYCDAGVGMTEADWAFVRNNGLEHGVPDAIAGDCVYPK